jgi:hypothetical protein
MEAETTLGAEERAVEKEIFHLDDAPARKAGVAAVA